MLDKVGQGKLERLNQFLERPGKGIDLAKSYFYTDSFVDAPVMKLFGNPVAVYMAKSFNWHIIGTEHHFG
jgi:phosphoserine phosphatase